MRFEIGDTVKIVCLPQNLYKQYNLLGLIGIVETIFNNSNRGIAVRIRDISNKGSNYGYFYFEENNLEHVRNHNNNKEDYMSNNYNVNEFKGEYTGVVVRFTSGDAVKYRLYPDGFEYKEGDVVVVKTKRHGLSVATIESFIYEKVSIDGEREIVYPVDMTKFSERLSKAKEIVKIRQEMDIKAKELQGIALYEMLAKDNSEMAMMLEQYKQLIN